MSWSSTKKYETLLRINNAIIKEHTREGLFRTIATEIKKDFHYDRCSINLYDSQTESLTYFATAEGIKPEGITRESRPLSRGAIASLVMQSRTPVIIKDLSQHPELTTADTLLKEGLRATMAFPLVIREKYLGSFHVAFKELPSNIDELSGFCGELTAQITIAVDNMLFYEEQEKKSERLETQKQYVLEKIGKLYGDFYFQSPVMSRLMEDVNLVAGYDTTVLITGETGTGKDHIARYDPQSEPQKRPALREGELCGPRAYPHRERAFRACKGVLHRRQQQEDGPL